MQRRRHSVQRRSGADCVPAPPGMRPRAEQHPHPAAGTEGERRTHRDARHRRLRGAAPRHLLLAGRPCADALARFYFARSRIRRRLHDEGSGRVCWTSCRQSGLLASHDMDEAHVQIRHRREGRPGGSAGRRIRASPWTARFCLHPGSWWSKSTTPRAWRTPSRRSSSCITTHCAGKAACLFQLTHEAVNGRTYHALKMPDVPVRRRAVHVHRWLPVGRSQPPLLDRAIQYRAMRHTRCRARRSSGAGAARPLLELLGRGLPERRHRSWRPWQACWAAPTSCRPSSRRPRERLRRSSSPCCSPPTAKRTASRSRPSGNLLGLSINNLIQGNLMGVTRGFGLPGMLQMPGTPDAGLRIDRGRKNRSSRACLGYRR